jgi:hypothetical protein
MGLRYSKQMLSLVSKHKMELFYSGLFVGLFCGWLNWFGSATLQKMGLTADYTEKTQLVDFPKIVIKEGLSTGTLLESAAYLRITYPASIDLNASKPLRASLGCPQKCAPFDDITGSYMSEQRLRAFVSNAEFEVTVKPELDAPSFNFQKQSFGEIFKGQQLNWRWIVTPTKEGMQSFSVDFVFQVKRKGATESTEYHVPSKTLELAVVQPFVTLGQINFAVILTGILGCLLATPKLIEIVKSVAKHKPKQTTIGYLAHRSKSNSSTNKRDGKP